MRLVPLVLLGFGNVGQALAELLLRKEQEIAQRYGLALRVVGIGTGRHGAALDQAGLELPQALGRIRAGEDLAELSSGAPPADSFDLLNRAAGEALLESTPVNYDSGQPAVDYLRTALELGMHAVTANKGPVVHAYQQLNQLAERRNRKFLFESAVMDGAPVFSLWRAALPGARLRSLRGVLNSTTNYILTQIEAGESMSAAIAGAQAIGVAETDPSGDLEGWDAAIKVAALVNVLMQHRLTIAEVERRGIDGLNEEQVRHALAEGKRWKLVCTAERGEGGVVARVAPEMVGPEDPLYTVVGTSSAVTLVTDVLGELTLTERDPGPHTTAYGMLADLLNALR